MEKNHEVKGNQVSWLAMEKEKKNEGALRRVICSGAGNGIVFPEDIDRNVNVVEKCLGFCSILYCFFHCRKGNAVAQIVLNARE